MEYTSRLIGETRRKVDGVEKVMKEYLVVFKVGSAEYIDIFRAEDEEDLKKLISERVKTLKRLTRA